MSTLVEIAAVTQVSKKNSDKWGELGPVTDRSGSGKHYDSARANADVASGYTVTRRREGSGKTAYSRLGEHPNVERRTGFLKLRKRTGPDRQHVRYYRGAGMVDVPGRGDTSKALMDDDPGAQILVGAGAGALPAWVIGGTPRWGAAGAGIGVGATAWRQHRLHRKRKVRKDAASERKRKEEAFGLANNAFGASAGVMGTRAVYQQSRAARDPAWKKAQEQKAKIAAQNKTKVRAARAQYRAAAPGSPSARAANLGSRIAAKTPAPVKAAGRFLGKHKTPLAVGGAVAMQLANAGADAQSAAYFGRELSRKHPKTVTAKSATWERKGSQVGHRITEPKVAKQPSVSKAYRRFDSEMDRQQRLGIYQGAGGAGAIGLGAATAADLKRRGVTLGKIGTGIKTNRLPIALATGATASGAGAVAARRAYLRDRNRPWT